MRYNVVKNANKIIDSSSYLVKNPESYKGKWKDVFSNNNPICLELGMGRGSFIIEMAKKHPNINYIGLELDSSQTATAINNIKNQNISKNSNNTDTKRHNCFQVYGSRNTFQSRIIVDKHHQVKHHHRNDA